MHLRVVLFVLFPPPKKTTCDASLARKPGLKKAGPWTAEWNSDIVCALFSIIRPGVARDISMIPMIPLYRWRTWFPWFQCVPWFQWFPWFQLFLAFCFFAQKLGSFWVQQPPSFGRVFGRVSKIPVRWLHDGDFSRTVYKSRWFAPSILFRGTWPETRLDL